MMKVTIEIIGLNDWNQTRDGLRLSKFARRLIGKADTFVKRFNRIRFIFFKLEQGKRTIFAVQCELVSASFFSNKMIDTMFTTALTDLLVWTGITGVRALTMAILICHQGFLLVRLIKYAVGVIALSLAPPTGN